MGNDSDKSLTGAAELRLRAEKWLHANTVDRLKSSTKAADILDRFTAVVK